MRSAGCFGGPSNTAATAAVLALLWLLVIATVVQRGLHVPSFAFEAFAPANPHVTFGGYVRLLALMTGSEVFANLVELTPETMARYGCSELRSWRS